MSSTSNNNYENNLGYLFSDQTKRNPDSVCIIDLFEGDEKRLTYGEFERRIDRAARRLYAAGLRDGDRLALFAGNRSAFLEVFFGAMRMGAIPAPANHAAPRATIAQVLDDTTDRAAVVDMTSCARVADVVDAHGVEVRIALDGDRAGWQSWDDLPGRRAVAYPEPHVTPTCQAFQPYTAGSTGRPKGVVLTHHGMMWSARMSQRFWPVTPDRRGLVAVPLFHKNAMRGTVKPMLYGGGSIVLLPHFTPASFLTALANHRCTDVTAVPAVFHKLSAERDLLGRLDLTSVTRVNVGSASVSPELLADLRGLFPRATVLEAYGLTEGGGPLRPPPDGRPVPLGSCGVPAPETDIRLVDRDGRNVEEGELWVRSPAVARGYHNRPDETARRFAGGWLKTGDIFRRDADGFFHFRGRVDDMFSCGGENVYPKEVEALLVHHPAVADAVAAPLEHAVKGHAPAAVVVLKPGKDISEDALKRFALSNGPTYLHPRRILFVRAIPTTPAGKPDRAKVAADLAAVFGRIAGGGQ